MSIVRVCAYAAPCADIGFIELLLSFGGRNDAIPRRSGWRVALTRRPFTRLLNELHATYG